MLRYYKIAGVVLCIVFSFTQCRPPERRGEVVPEFVSGVYVTNEGNYQFGNSSVSYLDQQTGHVTHDVFLAANGFSMGDVCQSMIRIGAHYYLVMNGSGRVEVVDTADFKVVKTITGCQSPRYILPLSATKGYLTDLYDNKVHILNLATNEITGSISIPTWTEALVYANNKVYVSAPHSKYVFIVDPLHNVITDSIEAGEGISSMVLDKNNSLWLLSNGDLGAHDPFVAKVDIATDQIIFQETLDHAAGNLTCSDDKAILYWLEDGVVKLPVDSAVAKRTTIIAKGSHNWYGLGVHPFTEDIYVSDALSYLEDSEVFIYSKEGVQKSTFTTGIISGGFWFKISGQ
jgi:DNA-binding beta-propeller fold protein YncE